MLPRLVCIADELPLDFDLWKEIVLNNFRSELSADQMCCMESIDRSLSELTHMGPEHWREEAVRESDEWKSVRTRTASGPESFGWAREIPPSHAGEYVMLSIDYYKLPLNSFYDNVREEVGIRIGRKRI